MKIINPSVEIMGKHDGEYALKHIEACGRVCYQSEAKDGGTERFVRSIIRRGHESVLEHYSFTMKFICDRGVSHEIVRHRVASYCVTGDTVIRGMAQKSWTVKELYNWQGDSARKGRISLINARSMDDKTRTIVANKITGIHYMGNKPVFAVRTESGRNLKCTCDHKIATPDGYKELQELSPGSTILANGFELLDNPDWIRWYYIEENHTRKETAEAIGCSEATLFKAFRKYGIKKPWSDRPNRHPGHGKKGMFTAEAKQKIREAKQGKNNPHYKKDRSQLSLSGAYQDALKKFKKTACENCGKTDGLEIHHIDKNPRNNTIENIKVLCVDCHKLWHKSGKIGVFRDKIVSIEPCGNEDVYDVSMADPHHNFVANGIVVHNCQESSRYCNYYEDKFGREITVIRPIGLSPNQYSYWGRAMIDAECAYMDMLKDGSTPEMARSVLPNSLKTTLVMTANFREWRHFFKLRCDSAAHPQMRQVALMALEIAHNTFPVIFDDLAKEYLTNE